MLGFTYNGVHCSAYGVYYIPDASDRWWEEAKYTVRKKAIDWRNGGYLYGSSADIREFTVKCYFEEISIATREKIRRWLGRTTHGKLIFDERPFVYYDVVPSSVTPGELYDDDNGTNSGTFSVKFMAENPFGYLTRKSNAGAENDHAEDYCGMISTSAMPPAPTTSSTSFDVYNPGTESCGLSLVLAGTAQRTFRFLNNRNQTSCIIRELPTNNMRLDLNGDTGMVKTYIGNASSNYNNGFAYHDRGFVRLDPCEVFTNIGYNQSVNGTYRNIQLTNMSISEDMIGANIQFNTPATRSARVVSLDSSNNTLICALNGSGTLQNTGTLTLFTMNRITIEELNTNNAWVTPTGLNLSYIHIDYQPRLL